MRLLPTWSWWGAGVTGVIASVLLARAGKDVLVLEGHTVGAGATGTAGKISLLQGPKLSQIVAKYGSKLARHYLDGNRDGQERVLRHCENHGLAV